MINISATGHPMIVVVCENKDCKWYGVQRQVFLSKSGDDLYAFKGVFCICQPDRELRQVNPD